MLSHFLIEISQFVQIFEPEVSKKSWKSLDYVEKSWKVSINLKSLDKSRQSRFVSTISINILTKINLDRKISILKISTEKKKVSLDGRENLDSFKKLVSTIEIEKCWFCFDTSEKSGKSRSRPRNLSRHDIFGKSRQFVSISIES